MFCSCLSWYALLWGTIETSWLIHPRSRSVKWERIILCGWLHNGIILVYKYMISSISCDVFSRARMVSLQVIQTKVMDVEMYANCEYDENGCQFLIQFKFSRQHFSAQTRNFMYLMSIFPKKNGFSLGCTLFLSGLYQQHTAEGRSTCLSGSLLDSLVTVKKSFQGFFSVCSQRPGGNTGKAVGWLVGMVTSLLRFLVFCYIFS